MCYWHDKTQSVTYYTRQQHETYFLWLANLYVILTNLGSLIPNMKTIFLHRVKCFWENRYLKFLHFVLIFTFSIFQTYETTMHTQWKSYFIMNYLQTNVLDINYTIKPVYSISMQKIKFGIFRFVKTGPSFIFWWFQTLQYFLKYIWFYYEHWI